MNRVSANSRKAVRPVRCLSSLSVISLLLFLLNRLEGIAKICVLCAFAPFGTGRHARGGVFLTVATVLRMGRDVPGVANVAVVGTREKKTESHPGDADFGIRERLTDAALDVACEGDSPP